MADAPNRSMKFPYTITAKLVQFPYKYYWKHTWMFKYVLFGALAAAPVFWKIQMLSYSEENQRIWNEKRRKEFEGHH